MDGQGSSRKLPPLPCSAPRARRHGEASPALLVRTGEQVPRRYTSCVCPEYSLQCQHLPTLCSSRPMLTPHLPPHLCPLSEQTRSPARQRPAAKREDLPSTTTMLLLTLHHHHVPARRALPPALHPYDLSATVHGSSAPTDCRYLPWTVVISH